MIEKYLFTFILILKSVIIFESFIRFENFKSIKMLCFYVSFLFKSRRGHGGHVLGAKC